MMSGTPRGKQRKGLEQKTGATNEKSQILLKMPKKAPQRKKEYTPTGTLVYAQSFKAALGTKVQMSDHEIDVIIKLVKEKPLKD